MKLISGNSNRPLAEGVAEYLGILLMQANIRRFADKEVFVEILESVAGEDVFLMQPTSYPVNDTLMELLIIIDALKRGAAERITAVIPYYGYGRQDRKTGELSPISAKLVANLLTTAGVDRVLTVDLHSGQIQGFFDIPTDDLYALPLFSKDLKSKFADKPFTIVSPDIGGIARARVIAGQLGVPLAIIDKRRDQPGVSEVVNIIGEVAEQDCVIIDDMVDSGGTLCNGALSLIEAGAHSVRGYITHGVLSDNAVQRIVDSPLEELVITNSIESRPEVQQCPKIRELSLAPLLADAIARIANE